MFKRKKKGSATFMVVMLMSALLILTVSLLPLTLTSINQSRTTYSVNRSYYTGEGVVDKILYDIDVFCEVSRISVYNKCFIKDEKESLENRLNLNNPYIYKVYKLYRPDVDEDGNYITEPISYEEFESLIYKYYKYEFNKAIKYFFSDNINENQVVSLIGDENKKENVIYKWELLKNASIKNKEVNIEPLSKIDSESIFSKYTPLDKKDQSNIDVDYTIKNESVDDIYNYLKENEVETLRETFYLESKEKNDIKTYSAITVDFKPERETKVINGEKEKELINKALNYGLICEDNLEVTNNLSVDTDIIVGGEGEPKGALDNIEYGGLIAGKDGETGSVNINGNAFVGEESSRGKIHGGFIKTLGEKSSINITGDSYSHSIVTNENSKNTSINIGKSAYIADNISLNGDKNNINIKNHLVGFEDGADIEENYLSSPSIVINDINKSGSNLSIGGQVALLGEGFVENIIRDGRLFKTFEVSAIYPNYISYASYLENRDFDKYYNEYSIKNKDELFPIDMFDKYEVINSSEQNVATLGINFMLNYFIDYKESIKETYNMGENITANINLSNKLSLPTIPEDNIDNITKIIDDNLNVSCFNYIMYSNGKMYLTKMPDEALLEGANNAIKESGLSKEENNIITPSGIYSFSETMGDLRRVFDSLKNNLLKRMNLEDVVSNDTLENNGYNKLKRLDRCFNWNKANAKINKDNLFVKISKEDIYLSEEDLEIINNNDTKTLIASGGNIIVNGDCTVRGSLIAKKNIFTNGNVSIDTNSKIAMEISSYKDNNLQGFLEKGKEVIREIDTIKGISKTVKSNIKVVNKRQLM